MERKEERVVRCHERELMSVYESLRRTCRPFDEDKEMEKRRRSTRFIARAEGGGDSSRSGTGQSIDLGARWLPAKVAAAFWIPPPAPCCLLIHCFFYFHNGPLPWYLCTHPPPAPYCIYTASRGAVWPFSPAAGEPTAWQQVDIRQSFQSIPLLERLLY